MLSSGIYIDKTGTTHQITQLSEKGYYRFDMQLPGTRFQVNPEAVEYSIITRRKTISYGACKDIYDEMKDFIAVATSQKLQKETSTEIRDGHFWQTVTETNDRVRIIHVFQDGLTYSEHIEFDDRLYSLDTISTDPIVHLDPINITDYEEETLVDKAIEVNQTAVRPYRSATQLRAMYNLEHILKKDFVVTTDIDIARERLKRFKNSSGYKITCSDGSVIYAKAFDTETTGTEVWKLGQDKMVGIVLSESPEISTYYPFRHDGDFNLPIYFLKEIVDVLESESDKLIAHNTRFDRQVMLKEGYNIFIRYCSLQLAILVNYREKHGLKDKVMQIIGKKFLELNEVFYDSKYISFGVISDPEVIKLYALSDGPNALIVFEDLLHKIPKETLGLYMDIESVLANYIADQEYYGIRMNYAEFLAKAENCSYVVQQLERAFRILTKSDGKISSPNVISDLIYNKMRCPVLARTDSGQPSTNSAVLLKLAAIKNTESVTSDIPNIVDKNGKVVIKAEDLKATKYPAILVLSKYREWNKKLTAYYNSFKKKAVGDRIPLWVNQNGAASGRQSSPMHQLPPELKSVIISDNDDWFLYDGDWSCVELRIQAGLAGEKEVCEMASDPNIDVHRILLSRIQHKPIWAITDEERKKGKRTNFGVIYEISGYGLAKQRVGPGATAKDVREAENDIIAYFKAFKRTKAFQLHNERIIKQEGRISTAMYRYRTFEEVFDKSIPARKLAKIVREGNNTPVQGYAADLMKLALINFNNYIHNKGWDKLINGFPMCRVMISIHDEVLISAHKSIPQEEIYEMYRECMEMHITGFPTLFVEPCLCETFADHDDSSRAIPVNLRDSIIDKYHKGNDVPFLTEDNVIKYIDDYKTGKLNQYMEATMKTYGPDLSKVAEQVRDPALVFDLLDIYKKDIPSDLSQEEKIAKATELYFTTKREVTSESTTEDKKDDEVIRDNYLEPLETMVDYDQDGNVIYAYADIQVEDEDDQELDEDIDFDPSIRVWELFDAVFFDLNGLLKEQIDEVLAEIWNNRQKDGFMKCIAIIDEKSYDLNCRMERVDIEHFENYIKERIAG